VETCPEGTEGTCPEGTEGTCPEGTEGTCPEEGEGSLDSIRKELFLIEFNYFLLKNPTAACRKV
jgi:hypothetical protein